MREDRLTVRLHANFSGGQLHLWGEDWLSYDNLTSQVCASSKSNYSGSSGTNNGSATAVVDEQKTHPFAASAKRLRELLPDGNWITAAEEQSLVLRLPSVDDLPLPSDNARRIKEDNPSLQSFELPTLALDPATAFDLLTQLDRYDQLPDHIAGSLAWLVRVALLVAELIIDQRYIPTLFRHADGTFESVWEPWLQGSEAERSIRRLLSIMPAVARAAVDSTNHQPIAITTETIEAMLDGVVRRTLLEEDFQDALDDRREDGDPHVMLLDHLLRIQDERWSSNSLLPALFDGHKMWTRRLEYRSVDSSCQLTVKVHEPIDDSPHWHLSLHVRTNNDEESMPIAEFLGHDSSAARLTDELHEAVLEEIGRVAPIEERLQESLDDLPPGIVALSTADAYEFLKTTTSILREAGVIVNVPEWWGQPTGRLGLRLSLDPLSPGSSDATATATGRPNLGLEALVNYQWHVSVGDTALSAAELKKLSKEKSPLVQIAGKWVELKPDDLAAAAKLLAENEKGEMTVLEAVQLAYGVTGKGPGLPVTGIDANGWISDLLDGRSFSQLRMVEQPEGFKGSLRPYQIAGISWLSFLESFGLGGCLADDMGLGKTIQLIALLQHERELAVDSSSIGPTLIVVPLSVVNNWQREIERFAPKLHVHIHHGPDRPMGEAFTVAVTRADVVVTTYGLVNRDIETLQRITWHRIVLDEAQNVKNTPTKQAQAIRALDGEHRIAMTGTPVENRLSELWSIMDFCNPGYLGKSPEFRRRFAVPIERNRNPQRIEALRGLIKPFVLRRLKTDRDVIPDLPELVTTKEYAGLTDEQAALYQEVVDAMLADADTADGIQRRGLVLAGIVRLKQICNHPANLAEDVQLKNLRESNAEVGNIARQAKRSGKVQLLLDRLEEVIGSRDQALIFTQYRRMGDLLERIIRHELDVEPLFMHGGVSRTKRQEMVDQFQDAKLHTPVFVLSLKAGGVGLNLTAANHVFHFDRWWNPAVENQATDRAFRIGQKRTVQVHKMVCSGTLEERIDQMLEEKSELAEQVVGSGDAWLTELSTSQLRDLVSLRSNTLDASQ